MDENVGYRFHPTEEEIILYFLERKMRGLDLPKRAIAEVDICKFEPWELPEHSPLPRNDQLWYFFNALVYKNARGKRIDRTTATGFWKVTGKDRPIRDKQGKKEIGFKKNLVFYRGRAPNGIRTSWVMHVYHSNNSNSYQKEYVLCRLKIKSGDRSDTCNEANRNLASDPRNYVAATSQVNDELSEDLRLHFEINGLDRNSLSAFLGTFPPEQGTSYSNGFGNECNLPNTHFDTIEQENAFVNSFLAEQDEFSGETSVHTLLNDFNPSKSLRGVHVGDSSDTDTEFAYEQGQVQESASFFDENISLEEYTLDPMVRAFYENSSSDGERLWAESGFVDEIVDSDTDMLEDNCLELVVDEFPTNTRACKSQHTPKSQSFIEKKCAPQELHLQSKALRAAVSKVQVREAAVHAVDLPKTENSVVRFAEDQKMPQTLTAKTSLKSGYSCGASSNRKGSFIFLETPPLHHKNYPPLVYLGNMLVSLLLIVIFVREMACLH